MANELPAAAEALLEEYCEDLKAQAMTPGSVATYRLQVRHFLRFLGETPVETVSQETLKAYLAALRKKRLDASTITRYFGGVSSLFVFLQAENRVVADPVPAFRRRYLKALKRDAGKPDIAVRQLISVEDMRALVHSLVDVRDRAALVVLAKTGVRAAELAAMDVEDINWKEQSIRLKKKRKRTNRIVYFDDETVRVLKRWLPVRKARVGSDEGPLFLGNQGRRLNRHNFHDIVVRPAQALGLHDAGGPIEKQFTAHCCRHWFTTFLRRAGMTREHVGWLRGDAPRGTMDIYLHIDPAEVRESYIARIPKLGL